MSSLSKRARVAGLLYVALGVVGPVRLMYIPNKLLGSTDASVTANNIAEHTMLFRAGIVADLLTGLLAIFVAVALYRLLKEVDRGLAIAMVILGSLMVTPIYFVNTINDAGALLFARGADFLAAFDKPHRDAMVMMFLHLHHQGVLANEIFWGLWLFPMGLLIYRSKFLPRVFGGWLILNGIAYLAGSFTGLLAPQYEARVFNILFPAMLGEVATMLWLLVMGAKQRPMIVTTASAGS
jgi:hypothetical protein